MAEDDPSKKKTQEEEAAEAFKEAIEEELGEEGEESSRGVKLGDAIKKVVTAGVGAAFMTEESVRAYVSELRLPRDAVNMLIQSATKSKEELTNRIGNEMSKVISRIDFVKEASRFVEEHKFKINAEVEVIKRDVPPSRTNPPPADEDSPETE